MSGILSNVRAAGRPGQGHWRLPMGAVTFKNVSATTRDAIR